MALYYVAFPGTETAPSVGACIVEAISADDAVQRLGPLGIVTAAVHAGVNIYSTDPLVVAELTWGPDEEPAIRDQRYHNRLIPLAELQAVFDTAMVPIRVQGEPDA